MSVLVIITARAARAYMVARSRFAEDELARAIARGAARYVVLGAGLDTFAYRHGYATADLHVFEVDHPATQAWKRRRLEAAGIAVPPSLTFAPVDFEQQTIADGLARAGFDRGRPAFFSWLGISMYLSVDTIASTLALVGAMPPASGIVFDYAVPRATLGLFDRIAHDALARRVAVAGEPFRSFFAPDALRELVLRAGFRAATDLDRPAINARYFGGRTDCLRIRGELGRFMSAER